MIIRQHLNIIKEARKLGEVTIGLLMLLNITFQKLKLNMKILMVCLGNICSSPLAEGILRDKVKNAGLNIEVESAGTSGYHNGQHADERAIATLHSKGINIMDLRSRLFIESDFENYDYIFTMDESNQRNVMLMAKKISSSNLPEMVMNLAYPTENISAPDPYYGGVTGFEDVYKMLDETLDVLIERLVLQ